jgi:hypothetical protein
MPTGIDDFSQVTTIPPPPISPLAFTRFNATVAGGDYHDYFGGGPPFVGGVSGSTVTFDIQSASVGTQHVIVSIAMSVPVKFSDHLTIATNRIRSRSWPSFFGGKSYTESYGEFDDLQYPDGVTPKYDGNWHANGVPTASPYTGGNSLWTGWIWPSLEEDGGSVDAPYLTFINTSRCRFKVNAAVPYFIARATINRPSPGPTPDGSDSLSSTYVLQRSFAVPGVIYEVPWPVNDPGDFQDSYLFRANAPTLSMGECCFAIVGESPAAWSIRTGIHIDG